MELLEVISIASKHLPGRRVLCVANDSYTGSKTFGNFNWFREHQAIYETQTGAESESPGIKY
jgi:hypothetical protein